MHRKMLPFPAPPKEISVREHDYSIRVTKVAGIPNRKNKTAKNAIVQPEIKTDQYEVTELFIEPIIMNVVKVLTADGTVTPISLNIPLEDVCHTTDTLEITAIDDLMFEEDVSNVIHLNDVCKVCLKNLNDSPDAIQFFEDWGLAQEIANISAALDSMKVEVTNDSGMPKQMCIECFNIFSKMTLFKQICERSSRALAKICEFAAQQQLNVKVDNDLSILSDVSPDIIEIKEEEEQHDTFEPTIDYDEFKHTADDNLPLEKDNNAENPLHIDDNNEPELTKLFICIRCAENFANYHTLVYHRRYVLCVDQQNPECRVCNEKLPTLKDLDHHLETSHNCFPCSKCSKSFNTLVKYNKHQRYHGKLICDLCTQTFYSKRVMLQHLRKHVKNKFPCEFCEEKFATTKRLGMHKRSVHPNELYKCPHCPKEFKVKDQCRVHMMKHNPDKRYKCTYCPSQFVHRHHLENHVRTHTKEAPFLCNYCGKAFRGEVALRGHLSIHDSVTYPYRYRTPQKTVRYCTLCDYSSIHGNIKKHMIAVHGQGRREVKKCEFSCHICDKEFRQPTSLTNHLQTHNEVRDYHCPHCKASFRKSNYLRLHIDGVHLNKRPNKCDQCDAAYLISNDLKRHKMQKHSTERPFQCYYCHRMFSLMAILRAHIKVAHRTKSLTEISNLNQFGKMK